MELEYLESILEELWEAEGEQDFRDIRAELKDGGYLKQHKGEKNADQTCFQASPVPFQCQGCVSV